MQPLSLYLHIPFCTVKCSYCAFNIYTNLDHLIEPFVEALCAEIEYVTSNSPQIPVHTIYFGGGTPTLLTPQQFEDILSTLRQRFTVLPEAEISTEANPDDLQDVGYLEAIRSLGIHRLSIGVQSTQSGELRLFGRIHNTDMVRRAIRNARAAKFDNISVDLIYGTPDQTLVAWQESIGDILEMNPEHISMYALGIEPKTALAYWIDKGKVTAPDDDLAADMYDWASEALIGSGFIQYEISNWSKPGFESQHNKQYWLNRPYLGLGPGAHGYAGGIRYENVRSPHRYIKAMQLDSQPDQPFPLTPVVSSYRAVTVEDEREETIMMGMRLLQDGVSFKDFEKRFGVSLLTLRAKEIGRLTELGMVEQTDSALRLTESGRFVSNLVIRDLI
jgi:oxygen-independent coproporphyrinogen-3 oxidase